MGSEMCIRDRYNRQQANFGTSYVAARAYSLEQQNAARAHAGLCHAFSCIYEVRLVRQVASRRTNYHRKSQTVNAVQVL